MTKFPQIDLANARGPQVTIETSMGTIQLQLFPEQAPKTVENFVTHAKAGYYDGMTFHRVIPNFMIQGGDPTGTGMGGEVSGANHSKTSSHQSCITYVGPYPWPMRVLIRMVVNSLLFRIKI